MARGQAFAPLRSRTFRFYFASRVVNNLGNTMAGVALAFAVLHVTDDDPRALGYVLAAHTVPMVVFLLWGGVIADRFPRNVVLQVSNLASAVLQGAIAALVITDSASLSALVLLSLGHGTASGLGMPAMAGMLPQVVDRADLQQANALLSLARSGLTILGPTLSALLVVAVGPGWTLAFDALTWLASSVLLGFVRLPARDRAEAAPSTLSELAAGWSYVRSTQWLWAVVLGFGFLNAIHSGAWFALGPARAKETIGEQGWGLVLSAEAIGLLIMTLVLLRVPLQRPLLWGMLGISLLGVPIALLGAYPHLGLLLAAAFVAGAGTEVFGMAWNLAMAENVPEDMLSRAYSYDMLGSFVAMPVGQLVFGALAAGLGFAEVMTTAGVAYVLIALAVLASPQVRRLPRVVAAPERTG
ncbi:MFS transporter [Nocardioides sp. R-C-SC26]|uniref:MFS transporter n=1 Tax=Nocardioides sp. R-C-SC26 TaxID=2870414 RepID=UPI001E447911|nr:MFS transporter [Nocardioides sp. R-C-SC26]